jgi:cob(I)alamin adenosyltransferase
MKIYTKTGDDGTTGLIGGSRVRKSDSRIECYGTVDELNAVVGLAAVHAAEPLLSQLRAVQAELFVIGAQLAVPDEGARNISLPNLAESSIARLEGEIDLAEATLAPLRNFILPGGTELAARLHQARTVCRRAERLIVASEPQVASRALIVTYLNRLSDWLFVLARVANSSAQVADIPWVWK